MTSFILGYQVSEMAHDTESLDLVQPVIVSTLMISVVPVAHAIFNQCKYRLEQARAQACENSVENTGAGAGGVFTLNSPSEGRENIDGEELKTVELKAMTNEIEIARTNSTEVKNPLRA